MPVLRLDTLNPQILQAEYAVRGELAIRAEELSKVKLESKLTFRKLQRIQLLFPSRK